MSDDSVTPPIVAIPQPIRPGAQPLDIGADATSVHESVAAATAALPAGAAHALLFDATYDNASSTGVKALYMQKLADGWSLAAEGAYYGGSHVAGKVLIAKYW